MQFSNWKRELFNLLNLDMKKVVTFGEIMLRIALPDFLCFSLANSFDVVYGGGESNVAVSLAN